MANLVGASGPKPKDLPSPIPGSKEVASPEELAIPSGGIEEEAAPESELSGLFSQLGELGAEATEEITEELSPIGKEISSAFDELEGVSDIREFTPGAPVKVRLFGGLANNDKQKLKILKDNFSDEFEFSKPKDGGIQFKPAGAPDEEFTDVDPGLFETLQSIADTVGSAALPLLIGGGPIGAAGIGLGTEGGRELLKDVFADLTGEALEVVPAIAGEVGGSIAGGIGGSVPGAIGGAMAGTSAGAVAGVGAREAAIQAAGGGPTPDIGARVATAAVAAPLLSGAFGAGIGTARFAVGLLKDAFAELPGRRVAEAASIRKLVSNIAEELGGVGTTLAKAKTTPQLEGEHIKAVVEFEKDTLERRIGLVEDKAKQIAGDEIFAVDNFIDNAGAIFRQRGITVKPTKIKVNGKVQVASQASLPANFGVGLEAAQMRRAVQSYNKAQSTGGLTIGDIIQTRKDFASLGKEAKVNPNVVQGEMRFISSGERGRIGGLAADEQKVLGQVLKGTPEGKFVRSAKAQAEKRLSIANSVLDIFGNEKGVIKKGAVKGIKKLISKDEPQTIRNLKTLLGEGSEEFNMVRGVWVNDVLERSLNPKTGVVDSDLLKKEITRLGPDVMRELMPPAQLKKLELAVRRARDLPLADIKDPGARQIVRDGVVLSVSGSLFPRTKAAMLFRLFGGNSRAAQKLVPEELEKMAQTATGTEKTRLFQTLNEFEHMMKFVRTKKVNGREVLVVPPSATLLSLPAVLETEEAIVEE